MTEELNPGSLAWLHQCLPLSYYEVVPCSDSFFTQFGSRVQLFPLDSLTYEIDYEFLWGSDLLIVPVLEEETTFVLCSKNATQVSTYLPQSLWYDFYTSALVSRGGENVTLIAPLDTIPLLVRGGSILPMQEPSATTTLTRKNNLYLLAAADELGVAAGELYWDDGDSLSK
uniref:Glycosyl hydrolase family 31 C-terminal domain-containing protein n=1 Tax=Timema cristinae TaxID=61476 RepID=A0A7R9GRQ5_TIMCR|nr:unnamed protein product [Timema cristinae]